MEFHGAGIQNIGGGCLLLAFIVVGIEVIAAGGCAAVTAAAGAGKGDLLPVQLCAAHRTIPRLCYEGRSGGILNHLPTAGSTVNNGDTLCNRSITAGAGICALSFRLARRAECCIPSHGVVVMAERFPILRTTDGAGFRRFTGGIYPIMPARDARRFPTHTTGFRRYAGGLRPLVAERATFGISTYTTGFGSSAGGILPFVIVERYCTAGTEKDAEQNEKENVTKEF